MAEPVKAALVQGVVVATADRRLGGCRRDVRDVRTRHRVTQGRVDILILFWREGEAPGVTEAHQTVMLVRQPHIVDAQQIGDVVLKRVVEHQRDRRLGKDLPVKCQPQRFSGRLLGAVRCNKPIALGVAILS